MDALTFLRLVWPTRGHYCIAIPFVPKGSTKSTFYNRVFTSIEKAAEFAEERKDKSNIFYCVHTLAKERVWNPKKTNPRDGSLGDFEVRTQSNTLAAKAFFFDLDVGASEEGKPPKYATQREALSGLIEFCTTARLPKPLIVSSGGGLHVYWIMSDELTSAEWKRIAVKLKKLAAHHGLKFDPSRTTDNASVLRVAGTFNYKKDGEPRLVRTLTPVTTLTVEKFEVLIDTALIRANVQVPEHSNLPALPSDFNNTQKIFDGPPVSIKSLLGACPQIMRVAKLGGNVSEPEWYAALSSVRLVEKGEFYIHKISEKHPEYDPAATEAKVKQLADKDIGPTTCERWHYLHAATCEACPLWQKVKSPMAAARQRPADKAPTPKLHELVVGAPKVQEMIPPPPMGFRLSDQGVRATVTLKNGEDKEIMLYEHMLYPVRRVINKGLEIEEQVWRTEQPRRDAHEFIVMADALYDPRKLAVVLSNNGVYFNHENTSLLQKYMIAYIAKLQQMVDAESQHNHLGWIENHEGFIFPDKLIMSDGSVKQVSLSKGATTSTAAIKKKGTLKDQVALMNFYNHAAYIPQQFFVLCSLAAPIFYMTGHHGVIVNASGAPGASKSTALYTAASLWGQSEGYVINGTNRGATANARNERITTFANLPICVDEITHMQSEEASDLAMSITQPGGRIRLNQAGQERKASDGYKATIMLATANTSLHNLLSHKNAGGTAGSMRVFEIVFRPGAVHTKPQADDYLYWLKQHYGHIAEPYMAFVVRNAPAVERKVREVMKMVDLACGITSGERFWSATIASALVAGHIAYKLGLLPFDVKAIETWAIRRQVPYMRGVVREEYVSPLAILANYLELNSGNILIIQSTQQRQGSNISLAAQMPKGALVARYEQDSQRMYILKSDFRSYCQRIGANDRLLLEELNQPKIDANGVERRVVIKKQDRKVLGAGTDLAKAQAHVFAVDMSHPDVSGHAALSSMSTKKET